MKIFCTYKILNIVTAKAYYGSTNNFKKRSADHTRLLTRNKHHSIKLQNSWNKHGQDSFIFSVIETFISADDMLRAEKLLIDTYYCASYNISTEVTKGHRLGRPHTQETKDKLSKMFKGRTVSAEAIEKIKKARQGQIMRKGFKHSIESINKVKTKRAMQVMKSGWKMSVEAKEKMSLLRPGNKYPRATIITKDAIYLGYEAAANALNVSKQSIRNWIKSGKEGFRLEYNPIGN